MTAGIPLGSRKAFNLRVFLFSSSVLCRSRDFLVVPPRESRLAAGIVGSIDNRLIRRFKNAAEAMKELAAEDPGVLNRYFASVRGGPTSLFSLAPNALLNC
jgi:hypothetical protein